MKFTAADLTSQHFWDQMNVVPLEKLPEIEQALVREVVRIEPLQLQALAYDPSLTSIPTLPVRISGRNCRSEDITSFKGRGTISGRWVWLWLSTS